MLLRTIRLLGAVGLLRTIRLLSEGLLIAVGLLRTIRLLAVGLVRLTIEILTLLGSVLLRSVWRWVWLLGAKSLLALIRLL
ncbi:hypothetical protein [Brevibacterium sp. UCMA 11754]|uniref:hypothetical protein n=1 Tax=Brevibacterium sp. UCMA 11754 TaxID=2749198 RepID=UPI001F2ED248|nr:hypothetical protein [Brevibacterium sp. UCMA 11754]